MFKITKNDKKQIINILLKHSCKCSMATLSRHYHYYNDEKCKRKKIRYILRSIENNGTIRLKIAYIGNYVEMIF